MKKLLTLTAVLVTAFFMSAAAQTSDSLQANAGNLTRLPADSLPSLSTSATGTSTTQLATTQFVSAPAKTLTVIIGSDTLHAVDTLNVPSQGPLIPSNQAFGIAIPPIVQLLLIILGTIIFTVLPAIQAVLKVVPTETSIRIQGWLGKILDFATAFIKDAKLGGGFHS